MIFWPVFCLYAYSFYYSEFSFVPSPCEDFNSGPAPSSGGGPESEDDPNKPLKQGGEYVLPALFLKPKSSKVESVLREDELKAIVYPSVKILADAKAKGVTLTQQELYDLEFQDDLHFFDLCDAKLLKEGKKSYSMTMDQNPVWSIKLKNSIPLLPKQSCEVGVQARPDFSQSTTRGLSPSYSNLGVLKDNKYTSVRGLLLVSDSPENTKEASISDLVPVDSKSTKATSTGDLPLSIQNKSVGCKFPCLLS